MFNPPACHYFVSPSSMLSRHTLIVDRTLGMKRSNLPSLGRFLDPRGIIAHDVLVIEVRKGAYFPPGLFQLVTTANYGWITGTLLYSHYSLLFIALSKKIASSQPIILRFQILDSPSIHIQNVDINCGNWLAQIIV